MDNTVAIIIMILVKSCSSSKFPSSLAYTAEGSFSIFINMHPEGENSLENQDMTLLFQM